ncbi:MAG: DUF4837 family protein, partial [Candidatus Eisenbacteria bacterium]|nr:DUF4837 family protein [Candidatus Eisenbacteria bacterium]
QTSLPAARPGPSICAVLGCRASRGSAPRPGFPGGDSVKPNRFVWFLPLLLGLAACSEPIQVAKGSNQGLTLFTPWQRIDDRVEWVADTLESPVVVAIRPEKAFKVDIVDPGGIGSRNNWRTLAFLWDFQQPGKLRETARDVMSDEIFNKLVAGDAGYTIVQDMWARGQTGLFLHCADPEAFRDWLQDHGGEVLAATVSSVIDGLVETLFVSGEQRALQRSIHDQYGFSVRIPAGYTAEEDSANNVVRLRFIHYEGPALFMILHARPGSEGSLDPQWGLRFRDELVFHYNEGDRVNFERSRGRRASFHGQPATRLEGLWQNEEYTMGGGFRSILFMQGERFYFIDMAVFHPPGDKLPYMRELEAVASTFTTGPLAGDASS